MNVLILSPYPDELIETLLAFGDTCLVYTDPIDSDFINNQNVDFVVSFGYRHIIKPEVLSLLPRAAINLHISMLPSSRGAHPVFWSVCERNQLGVTIHYINKGLDTGNILFQSQIFVDLEENTFHSLYNVHKKTVIELFKCNWKYIREKECGGWRQQGPSTIHRSNEIEKWKICLPQSWLTPISTFRRLAAELKL